MQWNAENPEVIQEISIHIIKRVSLLLNYCFLR